MRGVDLEEVWADKFISVLAQLHIEDAMDEHAEDREKARGALLSRMKGYNSSEEYGMSNDNPAPRPASSSEAPLPYLEPTEQTADGYVGLNPPLGG